MKEKLTATVLVGCLVAAAAPTMAQDGRTAESPVEPTSIVVPAADEDLVTIYPDSPSVSNCYVFGGGGNDWRPYAAWIYQNVPAFDLVPGTLIAFDLGAMNDSDAQLEIALVPTTVNGGQENDGAFTTVVTNSQVPTNPRGDTVMGNFEMQFVSEASFSFPGGGLIVRFSNPAGAFASDGSCDQVHVVGTSSDTSGLYTGRAYRDGDGAFPWDTTDDGEVGSVQFGGGAPVPTVPVPALVLFGLLLGTSGVLALRARRRAPSA